MLSGQMHSGLTKNREPAPVRKADAVGEPMYRKVRIGSKRVPTQIISGKIVTQRVSEEFLAPPGFIESQFLADASGFEKPTSAILRLEDLKTDASGRDEIVLARLCQPTAFPLGAGGILVAYGDGRL